MTTVFYCERRSQRNCIVIPVYLLEVKKAARAAACILWRYWRGARRNILKTTPEQEFAGIRARQTVLLFPGWEWTGHGVR